MSTHIAASKADHNHWDYHFRRQMSDKTRDLDWEEPGLRPLEGWGSAAINGLGLVLFFVFVWMVVAHG